MRTHVLSLVLGGAVLSMVAACVPPTTACNTTTCTGCCDATGACQAGNSNLACGVSGGSCATCQGAQSCTFGVCGSAGTGGGSATGGGTGGGTTGGGGGAVGGGGGSAGLTQFCLDVTAAQADLYSRCGLYTAAGLAEQLTANEARCNTTGISSAYAAGRATFDSSAAAACLVALRAATCTNTTPPGYESCYGVFPGAVGANGNCFYSSECTSALYCDTSMTCPGHCVPRLALGQAATDSEQCPASNAEAYGGLCVARIALGQSCAPTGGQTDRHLCVDGAMCGPADTCITWMPTPLQASGQPCNSTGLECGLGLNCVTNVCTPLVTAGNACDNVRSCLQDLICSTANVCVARTGPGTTCATGDTCRTDLFCEKPTGMTTGTCAVLRTVDQTCTYQNSGCANGLYCTATSTMMTGVCKAPSALGAACTYGGSYIQCGAGYCTATSTMMTGVCANKKITGASCMQSQECQGTCAGGTCAAPTYCYDPSP